MAISVIEIIFFIYIFLGLYMLSLLVFIYYPNRKRLFSYPPGKPVPVSIVMPCYNEGKHIGEGIEGLLALNYPRDMMEIIVVDDKSTDDSAMIVQKYVDKYDNVRLIVNERNSGGAAEPTNIGVRAAKYDYVVVSDADSTPHKDALMRMIGFLQEDDRVAAVTCSVLAKEPRKFIQKLQAIEYGVISWSRKLLDLVDAVYVTPGPFALYRKDVLIRVGLFDTKNMTQDIEIVWRLLKNGYKARMCLAGQVYSETPEKFKAWFKQRIRWNIGGTQTLIKYKRYLFRKGMLGAFIVPFFSVSLFLGLLGLGLFIYLALRRILVWYLSTKYSIYASSAVVRFSEFSFSPSVLNYFGAILFILGAVFTGLALFLMRHTNIKKHSFFNVVFYMVVYLTMYPVIMVVALYKLSTGKYSW